jgi:hypothetical protein
LDLSAYRTGQNLAALFNYRGYALGFQLALTAAGGGGYIFALPGKEFRMGVS